MFRTACKTHIGHIRKTNEDYVFVDEELGLFIIADGLGGLPAGETASQLVSDAIQSYISNLNVDKRKSADIIQIIKTAVMRANAVLIEESKNHFEFSGMGTAVVFALIKDHEVYICNVGDSRAYIVNTKGIEQISKDQTLYQEMLENKIAPKSTREEEFAKNILTQHIGKYRIPEPHIEVINLKEDDYLLLCSDGLSNLLDEMEMQDIVVNGIGNLQDKSNLLVETALERGGWDNITVALIVKENRIFV